MSFSDNVLKARACRQVLIGGMSRGLSLWCLFLLWHLISFFFSLPFSQCLSHTWSFSFIHHTLSLVHYQALCLSYISHILSPSHLCIDWFMDLKMKFVIPVLLESPNVIAKIIISFPNTPSAIGWIDRHPHHIKLVSLIRPVLLWITVLQ